MTHVQLSLHDLSQLVVMQAQRGKSRDEIVRELMERGWPEVSARRFVTMTLIEQQQRASNAAVQGEDESNSKESYTNDQESRRVLWVMLLVTAVFIVCMLIAFAH